MSGSAGTLSTVTEQEKQLRALHAEVAQLRADLLEARLWAHAEYWKRWRPRVTDRKAPPDWLTSPVDPDAPVFDDSGALFDEQGIGTVTGPQTVELTPGDLVWVGETLMSALVLRVRPGEADVRIHWATEGHDA